MYYGELIRKVNELKEKTDGLYIYGAGMRGKEVCHILTRNGIAIEGFIVTKTESESRVLGFPVITASSVMHKNVGIILGLGDMIAKDVMRYLEQEQVNLTRVIDGGIYVSQDRDVKSLQNYPTVEVTTMMGCRVNCRYCPQKNLLKKYYEIDKNRISQMTVEDFKIFMEHTPENCALMFCGMSEPLLNPDCLKMLQLACDAGRNVLLYTTLEGATKEDIDKILQLQFQFVGLHAPDEKNYAHITVTEEYYCNFERLLNAKRKDGNPFVNNITAQANPLPRIAKMCEGKYEVLISLQDRAGNLEGDELASREHILTNERITCCLGGSKFNTNVLLPDGTLLLCDSDFGMQHVLGNLKEQTYDEIRRGEEMKKIFRGVAGDQGVDLLCRKCVLAMIER